MKKTIRNVTYTNARLERELRETQENLRASLWLALSFFLYGVIITACYIMGVK